VPLDRALAELSLKAFRRFGRGRHPAQLNWRLHELCDG
jgi:uncharacterized protein with PIN domain